MKRTLLEVSTAAAFTALAWPALLAGPATADITDISVTGLIPGKACSVKDGCTIIAGVDGSNKFGQVEFLINGASIGTVTPVANSGVVTASLDWHPTATGSYTIGVRQGLSMSTIVYPVGAPNSLCAFLPSGSASGSGGSGSASGSFGSGSAGSGSAGSGSAGSGSGTGSAC
ncbi:hypothetical protein [Nocardia acidivorans]|uniref:hypothetical protein n=1 Tax=Nocardia acidivorans TaxID=404580 RepID=UPI00082A2C96|nr:hypothetical protein [Nocardia acidivorans]